MLRFLIFAIVGILRAQDGSSTNYDDSRRVTVQGAITRIDWTNPHAYIFINVRDSNGTVNNWAVDIGNPLDLEKWGWNRNSVHIGDMVSAEGRPARGQSRRLSTAGGVVTRAGQALFGPPFGSFVTDFGS